ncbi:MAG: sugar transferase [Candidatus Pacebacteria bacterium]|nr:sugar transferase [Candidatus Paceibacterota bacterium]MDR3582747.1 sugar transferase [Candidatus Paceibacterota bacterium]
MKRSELFFSFIQVPVDYLMIVLAALSAFLIRNVPEVLSLKPKLYTFHFHIYLEIVLAVAPIFILIYAMEGLYDIRVTRKFWKEMVRIFSATSIGLVLIIVAIFLQREWFSSRFVILAAWGLATLYVVIARYLIQLIQKWLLRSRGIGVHRVLLIGHNGKMDFIAKSIRRDRSLGYKIVDQVNSASLKVVKSVKQDKGIDEIILCEPSLTEDEQEKLIDYCAIHNVKYKYIPTSRETTRYDIGVFNGEPLIEVKNTPLDGWGRIAKRFLDVVAATLGIVVTSPIMLATALAIKLDSDGPVIYRNERIGDDGRKFFVYKFRYFKNEYCISKDNPDLKKALELENKLIEKQSVRKGPLYKIKNDPRKTRVGAIIEKYSIDELPQFFNVLFGSMSIVGPRPHQKREVEKYMEYHRRLLTIRPGITGMAQISGRSDLDFEKEYRLDLYYIENWSIWLDFQILFKTFGVLFRKRRNS